MMDAFNRVLNIFGRSQPKVEKMCVLNPEMNNAAMVIRETAAIEDLKRINDIPEIITITPGPRKDEKSEVQNPEVEEHGKEKNLNLLKTAYEFRFVAEHRNDFLRQKSPVGNNVLHIAAMYGKNEFVENLLAQKATYLLRERNIYGDTPLHVAAKNGKIYTIKKLLQVLPLSYSEDPKGALYEILVRNKQGNTLFHEAILNGHIDGILSVLDQERFEDDFKELIERVALFWTNNDEKSVLHLAIENGYKEIVDHALTKLTTEPPELEKLIWNHKELAEMIPKEFNHVLEQDQENEELFELIPYGPKYVPPGESLLIFAILKEDQDILKIILKRKKEWIHLRDKEGRTALHYAASIGFLEGVEQLLGNCISCSMESDNNGFLPIHLASAGGHCKVVKKLLEQCPDPREMVDKYERNILHIAAENNKFNMVRYLLQESSNHKLVKMMNDQDATGNTPLHLAAIRCHPKIVHALTWDKRVNLDLVNKKNQTALGAHLQFHQEENPSLSQLLTWIALKSAGVKKAIKPSPNSIEVPLPHPSEASVRKEQTQNLDRYKDRINTLILVSTLITTVGFAAGITLPGGTNGSDTGQGMAIMLNQPLFKVFIFCITISMYGAISVTIILIWAQLGDLTLALLALKVAMPLLGVTLATLSVAFFVGVHLVISDISWLATTFLILCVIFIFMLLSLYALLWFPSSSSIRVTRYISYYPFLFLTWWAVTEES